jgi:hypothetical protein
VEKGVEDPLGRPAIGVTVTYVKRSASGSMGKQEIFFDPESYAYLGEVMGVGPIELPEGMSQLPEDLQESDPGIITARDAWGVVDKPGARP